MQIRLSEQEEIEFCEALGELADDPRCLEMKQFIQHGKITTYDHSVNVARQAFRISRDIHANVDEKSLVRAAFLHDYFLYDWHDYGDHLHGYHHPKIAASNAAADFGLSEKEQKIIQTHMWPLTIFHAPSSREAWILVVADKIVSSKETLFER